MEGRYLDRRQRPRRKEAPPAGRRRKGLQALELALASAALGLVWALEWIHPVPWGCLLWLSALGFGYRIGKEDGNV